MRVSRTVLVVSGLVLWCGAIAALFHQAMVWESVPGVAAKTAPAAAKSVGRSQLLLIAHTECPCTQAALKNLLTLSKRELDGMAMTIVYTGPGAHPGSKAVNVQLGSRFPGAKLLFCSEQEAATKYHAQTSGQAFLYDPSGRLVFSGGLTNGRGVEGECVGLVAIRNTIRGLACPSNAPVFGCALQTPQLQ